MPLERQLKPSVQNWQATWLSQFCGTPQSLEASLHSSLPFGLPRITPPLASSGWPALFGIDIVSESSMGLQAGIQAATAYHLGMSYLS